jgi:tetratricopeptide (TPR) repeat protein
LITRAGGTVTLEGFWARTTDRLSAEGRLVSDLTFGPRRSHHVASELLAQLDGTEEQPPAPARPAGAGLADGIAAGIEAESLGDRATLAALRLADRVCELAASKGIAEVVVLAPCLDSPWDRENVLFLRFLAQGLSVPLRIGCVGPRPTPPPLGLRIEWPPEPESTDGGLVAYAWKCFAEGSWDLAARLVGRAAEGGPRFEAHAQGMRIAMQDFEAAAAGPDPTPLYGSKLRAFLLESKGWALTMLNEPRRAEEYLASARSSMAGQNGSRDYLYLLNISALNRLKLGDADGAMAMEQEIRSAHDRLPDRDWPLEYVNSINIARLERRRGDLDAAERSYARAFATTLGARSQVDLVYTNLMWARLYEAMGRDDEAAAAWVRTALHWLASDAPEALGPRATAAFLGRPLADGEDLVEGVSAVLLEALGASAGDEAPPVIPVRRLEDGARLLGVGAPGWGVLVTPDDAAATVVSRGFVALRRAVGRLVGEPGTIVVDDRFGCDVPTTRAELLEVCVKRGAERLVFDGVAESLSADRRRALDDTLRVSLGPAVAAVDEDLVTFKRYLPPLRLEPEAARLVAMLDGEPSVAELQQRALLRELEEARVLSLRL